MTNSVSSTKTHWDRIYTTKSPDQVSWYQEHPGISMDLIRRTGVSKTSRVIDVGGGASSLVDELLDEGYQDVSVLDISGAALLVASQRLGARAADVAWLETDILQASLSREAYDIWHDRAVFHFLTRSEDRWEYVQAVKRALRIGGHLIVATFAEDGPTHCSGLEVARYSPAGLRSEFGEEFELVTSLPETHLTPADIKQKFLYCYCRRKQQ